MSRETIVGLIEALWIYLEHNEKEAFSNWLKWAEYFRDELSALPGVSAEILFQKAVEDGEPMAPFCALTLDEKVTGITGRELVSKLKIGVPVVFTIYEPEFMLGPCPGVVTINPQYILEGEHEVLLDKVKMILSLKS
jgi:hypothetical protein